MIAKQSHAVGGRIDWKYALGLELEDSGFDYSVLSEFRPRLMNGKAEQRLLDQLLVVECRNKTGVGNRPKALFNNTFDF